GAAGDAGRGRSRAPSRRCRRRRGAEAWTQPAEGAPGAGSRRAARRRHLHRARHDDRCGCDASDRQARRLRALLCDGAGGGLGTAAEGGRMSGRLAVIGLGPGNDCWVTPQAAAALAAADAVYGYGGYLDRVPVRPGQERHPSDNREEQARAVAALLRAAAGANVAVVSSGDPGVFAMAATVCAEIKAGPPAWRTLDVAIVPGITAMLAVAARAG